jgi:hypothetical protein
MSSLHERVQTTVARCLDRAEIESGRGDRALGPAGCREDDHGDERAIEESVVNFGKLRARLSNQRLGHLASRCVITGGQTRYTRPDGIHVISPGHLRA